MATRRSRRVLLGSIFTILVAMWLTWPRNRAAKMGLAQHVDPPPSGPFDDERPTFWAPFEPLAALEEPSRAPRAPLRLPRPPSETSEAPETLRENPRPPVSLLDDMPPPSAASVGDSRWLVWSTIPPRPGAPTRVTRRDVDRDVSHLLVDPLSDRDEDLGLRLPAAGTLATALSASVRVHTPPVSRATYAATLDGGGKLVAIVVVAYSSGERAQWQAAAAQAEAALAGRTFMLRGDMPHGAIVTVRLVQNLELPSSHGRKHRLESPPRLPWVPSPYAGRRSRREEGVGVSFFLPPDLARLGDPEMMLPPRPGEGGPTTRSELPCASGTFGLVGELVDVDAHEERVVKVATRVTPRPAPKDSPRLREEPSTP